MSHLFIYITVPFIHVLLQTCCRKIGFSLTTKLSGLSGLLPPIKVPSAFKPEEMTKCFLGGEMSA